MSSPNSDTRPAARAAGSGTPQVRLVLASASPRRRRILADAGVDFEVRPSDVEETERPDEAPAALVDRLAREKAVDVARAIAAGPPVPVLGADTIVVVDDTVLGKPRDEAHAIELLSRLVGRTHEVMTGIALAWSDGREPVSRVVATRVEMRPADRAELAEYVALGESLDKAGGYALQGEGRRFVVDVAGSRSNVIGLPLEETLDLLERTGARVHGADARVHAAAGAGRTEAPS